MELPPKEFDLLALLIENQGKALKATPHKASLKALCGIVLKRSTCSARYGGSDSGTEFTVGHFDDCLLFCAPDRLAECLQNLVENAIKYGDGRQISLGFGKMDGCEIITVTNTGCTLEEKELQQIFESFHRGANADKAQGNGLGLFICKRLMSLMDGEVYAEIESGCFSITLVVRLA